MIKGERGNFRRSSPAIVSSFVAFTSQYNDRSLAEVNLDGSTAAGIMRLCRKIHKPSLETMK
jgi:hypothetical protein